MGSLYWRQLAQISATSASTAPAHPHQCLKVLASFWKAMIYCVAKLTTPSCPMQLQGSHAPVKG